MKFCLLKLVAALAFLAHCRLFKFASFGSSELNLQPSSVDFAASRKDHDFVARSICDLTLAKPSDINRSPTVAKSAVAAISAQALNYTCYLSAEGDYPKTDFISSSSPDGILEQTLSPLLGACFTAVVGIWKYEFCYQKHARQLRAFSNKGQTFIEDFMLGRYIPAHSKIGAVTSGDASVQNYIKQTLFDGDTCDLTNAPREIEVRYYCELTRQHSYIAEVVEVSICKYAIILQTPLVCGFAELNPKARLLREDVECIPKAQARPQNAPPGRASSKDLHDLIDFRRTLWIQKLKAIARSSDGNYPLIKMVLSRLTEIQPTPQADFSQHRSLNFLKWMQMMGLEVDKLLLSADSEQGQSKSDTNGSKREERKKQK